jgi:DNA-binding response OmpR family regulator
MTDRVLILARRFRDARAIEATLVEAGFEAVIATDPEDAFALCTPGRCDVVAIDADPADRAGLDLCARLRERRDGPPVLALTDRDAPHQRLAALDAGADEILSRPGSGAELLLRVQALSALKALADRARVGGAPAGAGPFADARRPRVLVLDPEESSRTRLAELLGGDAEVTALSAPAQGLVRVAENGVDLAWVSEAWPDGGGWHLCRQLRLVDPSDALRTLIIAAGELRPRAMQEAGIDDGLTRPVDRCEALARTRLALRRRALALALRDPDMHAPPAPVHRLALRPWRAPPDRFAA